MTAVVTVGATLKADIKDAVGLVLMVKNDEVVDNMVAELMLKPPKRNR